MFLTKPPKPTMKTVRTLNVSLTQTMKNTGTRNINAVTSPNIVRNVPTNAFANLVAAPANRSRSVAPTPTANASAKHATSAPKVLASVVTSRAAVKFLTRTANAATNVFVKHALSPATVMRPATDRNCAPVL